MAGAGTGANRSITDRDSVSIPAQTSGSDSAQVFEGRVVDLLGG